MNNFKVKTYVPSLSTSIYVEEITNNNYLIINKFISSNDDEGLGNYLNNLYPELEINSLDKFFILLSLRSICIGDKIILKVNFADKPPTTLKLSVKEILKKIINYKLTKIPDFVKEDLLVKFTLPKKLYYKNLLSLLYDIIDDVIVVGKLQSIKYMSEKNKMTVIQKFNKDILKDIKLHIFNNSEIFKLTDLQEFSNLKICFTNNLALKIIKILFSLSISNFYYKVYNTMLKSNLSYDNFLSITPAESDLLLTIHKTVNNIK